MQEQIRTLYTLLQENTVISRDGFSIALNKAPDEWDRAIQSLGPRHAYKLMADRLCELYHSQFGEEFLFSEACIAFEIAFHADAYFAVNGYPGYHRNIATLPFQKNELIEHCKEIDISVQDISIPKQRIIFRYRQGIRSCYKNTPRDPFYKKP